ncbi:type IV secretion protein Rhs [Opitutaceae bacterium TAV5]|nr:type IV secretion protein Rhs [Opitutaceae bacterium TAV5]
MRSLFRPFIQDFRYAFRLVGRKTMIAVFAAMGLACAVASGGRAQVIDEPVAVAVKVVISATTTGYIPPRTSAYLYNQGSIEATIGDTAPVTVTGKGKIKTPVETRFLEPGRYYDLVINSVETGDKTVVLTPAPGYSVHVDGETKTKFKMSGKVSTKSFRILPAAPAQPAPAGQATSLASGRIHWQVSLGSLRNGESAGSLLLVGSGTSPWDPYCLPETLALQEESEEIKVHRNNKTDDANRSARQIMTNEAFVDIVADSATSYSIKFYNPLQATGSGFPSKPMTVTGEPFVSYKVEKTGDFALRITREIRSPSSPADNAPVLRTDITTLERQGSGLGLTWIATGWTLAGAAPVSCDIRRWASVNPADPTAGHTEIVEISDSATPSGVVATRAERLHTGYTWGHTPTREQLGDVNPAVSFTDYHNNAGDRGSYGFISATRDNGGSWQAYDYFPADEDEDKKLGAISRTYTPFVNAPGSVTRNTGQVTTYEYAEDLFGMLTRLKKAETRINGILAGTTSIAYKHTDNTVIATRSDIGGADGAVTTTVTRYYKENHSNPLLRRQMYSLTQPSGARQSYVYQRGTWDASTLVFTKKDSGAASRIAVIAGASASVAGAKAVESWQGTSMEKVWLIPFKSTTETTIRDEFARVARTESHVWDGSAWQLTGWTRYTYNYVHQLTRRESHNGEIYEAGWSAGLLAWERDAAGIETRYDYDAGARCIRKTTLNPGGQNLVATFTYDAAGNVLREEISSPGTTEKLVSTFVYDKAGRLVKDTAPGRGERTFSYNPAARATTTTHPDGGQKTETLCLDGRPASVTGSAVIPEYHAYAVEADGRIRTQVNMATATSPRWARAWTDWLGRAVRAERPGAPGQPSLIEEQTYDTRGLLVRTTRTGLAPTLYEYGPTGEPLRSGLDINNNGVLDLAGPDRISETDTSFVSSFSNTFWEITTREYVYPRSGSDARELARISGRYLSGGTFLSSTTEYQAPYNFFYQTAVPDRANRKVIITHSQTGTSATQVETVTGNQATLKTLDGRELKTESDALRRPVRSTDPRTGVTTTTYIANTTLVSTIKDPSGNVTSMGYDSMGRKAWQCDALGKYTRYAWNQRGQLIRQWGDAIMPVELAYNAYGERISLSTWRNGSNWSSATWNATGATADQTTWTYDPATGLLLKKTDAANRSVEYTYNNRGQIRERRWARTLASGARLATTYEYDSQTGDLLATRYNDGTPAVTRTLNRLGLPDTISDITGTRTFGWSTGCPWQLHTETLPDYYQNRVFTRRYGIGIAAGLPAGFQLGTMPYREEFLAQSVKSDSVGRVTSIEHTIRAARQTFAYTYLANSTLVQNIAATGTGFARTHTWDAKRNLLTGVTGKWSAANRSAFAYEHDALGRRTAVVQSGDAFAAYGNSVRQQFEYSDRGELTAAHGYLGATATQAAALPGRGFRYSYDAAGNRRAAGRNGSAGLMENFTVNALNQITARENHTVSVSGTADADAVAVDGETADRAGRYWQQEVLLDNDEAPAARQVTAAAVRRGAGTGGADLVQVDRRFAFIGPATETLTYDADGNLTGDGRWNYYWDGENRLVAMETKPWAVVPGGPPAQRLEFMYDYMGRRVGKRVIEKPADGRPWLLTSDLKFVYDGWNLVAETKADGTFVRSYAWGLDLAGSLTATGGVGALLQMSDHTSGIAQNYFATYDGNGNIAALVRASDGFLAGVYEYSPFGELLRMQGEAAGQNPFRFSTKYTDDETGLIYYGQRYYDLHNGRFINRDPIEERGGYNLYGFCENDAVNQWDILGHGLWGKLKKPFKKVFKGMKKLVSVFIPAAPMVWKMAQRYPQVATVVAGIATAWIGGWGATLAGAAYGTTANAVIAGAAGGFGGGFVGTYASGGSFSQALKAGGIGAGMGAATGYIGAQVQKGINAWKNAEHEFYRIDADPNKPGLHLPEVKIPRSAITGDVKIFENGILNDLNAAIKNGWEHYNYDSFILAHNPTDGFIADIVETALGKLTGTSSLGRDLAGVLEQINPAGSSLYLHSQGAQIGMNALSHLASKGVSMAGLNVYGYGGATNLLTSRAIVKSVGANWAGWTINAFDAVPNIVGLNAVFAPHRFITSLAAAPFLFSPTGHEVMSPHTWSTGIWDPFNHTY